MTPGQGIAARIEGKDILAGNSKLMEARQVMLPDELTRRAKQYLEQGADALAPLLRTTLAEVQGSYDK